MELLGISSDDGIPINSIEKAESYFNKGDILSETGEDLLKDSYPYFTVSSV